MDYTRLATILPNFVERELQCHDGYVRPLTINDFRLGIRRLRLTEIRDWSSHDLDLMETHAARFEDSAPLDFVLQLPAEGEAASCAAPVSSFCSPSPFAWT